MFSLVIPVYRNEGSIPDLVAALSDLNRQMGGDLEAVLVVDGSPDRSLALLREELPKAGFRSQLLALSRNFGSFAAIRAGLAAARGDLFAVMAADLQEPPELILEFRQQLETGDYDIAVGSRTARADSWTTRVSSALFWSLYRRLAQPEMISGGVDVFGGTREVRNQLVNLRESNSTLVGLLFWIGYRRCEVPYERRERQHGKSAWTLWRKIRYLLDSLFAFTILPVRLLTFLGLAGLGVSVLLGTIVITAKLMGNIEVPGYTATVLTVMFFGGLNSAGLGLIGEYLWRTFENTKERPNYIVAKTYEFETQE